MAETILREGQIIIGSLFNEPMRVETVVEGDDPRARAVGFLKCRHDSRQHEARLQG